MLSSSHFTSFFLLRVSSSCILDNVGGIYLGAIRRVLEIGKIIHPSRLGAGPSGEVQGEGAPQPGPASHGNASAVGLHDVFYD